MSANPICVPRPSLLPGVIASEPMHRRKLCFRPVALRSRLSLRYEVAFRSGKAPRLPPPARTNAVTGGEDCIVASPVTRHAYARDAGTRDLSAAPSSRCAGSRLVSTTIRSRSRAAGCGISASSWSRARAERECPTRRVRSERSNPTNGAPARTGAVLLSNTRL